MCSSCPQNADFAAQEHDGSYEAAHTMHPPHIQRIVQPKAVDQLSASVAEDGRDQSQDEPQIQNAALACLSMQLLCLSIHATAYSSLMLFICCSP